MQVGRDKAQRHMQILESQTDVPSCILRHSRIRNHKVDTVPVATSPSKALKLNPYLPPKQVLLDPISLSREQPSHFKRLNNCEVVVLSIPLFSLLPHKAQPLLSDASLELPKVFPCV